MTFSAFFKALWEDEPFPWQSDLADDLQKEGKWPTPLGLPTAAGKTAVIDLAIFALAMGWRCAARRVFFVVDRRIVVDEAGQRARTIAQILSNAGSLTKDRQAVLRDVARRLVAIGGDPKRPLLTVTMRGGQPRERMWAHSPVQPLVCCSTVDQVGSRLLFRGYGCSPGARPIHAALSAYDSVLFLDEAHLSNPFLETLNLIVGETENTAAFQGYLRHPAHPHLPPRLQKAELSATPSRPPAFPVSPEAFKPNLDHPILGPRLTRPKHATLVLVEHKQVTRRLKQEAERLAGETPKVVGVLVNRVSTAREVFAELQKARPTARHLLLIGRIRPLDRDALWAEWRSGIQAKRQRPAPAQPIFVVATQCVEAGANIDFDAIVTEAASLDALRQRFGRLNRMGNHETAEAVIVANKKETEFDEDGSVKFPHPVYGDALAKTWKWLNEIAQPIDFAHSALTTRLPEAATLVELLAPQLHAPILLPAHLDALCQTQPEPKPSPDVSVFLHGPKSGPEDVNIVWRQSLDALLARGMADEANCVAAIAACPPSSLEILTLPFGAATAWLSGKAQMDFADVEGESVSDPPEQDRKFDLPVLLWLGEKNSRLLRKAAEIRPGQTLVLPASFAGCDRFGWNPDYPDAVPDLAETSAWNARRRPFLDLLSHGKDAVFQAILQTENFRSGNLRPLLEGMETDPSLPNASRQAARFFAAYPRCIGLARLEGENQSLIALRSLKRLRSTPDTVEEEESLPEDDAQTLRGRPVTLSRHTRGVAQRCAGFVDLIFRNLDQHELGKLKETFRQAALHHDIGKADPRFQAWLRGGDRVKALSEPLLAKGIDQASRRQRDAARELARYPKNCRHEFMSLALLQANCPGWLDDLAMHLVAAHHGHARPLAPIWEETFPADVTYQGSDWHSVCGSDHHLSRLDSGVARRFWRLTRNHGWWGLAYLEALLNLADHRQSEAEQMQRTK